MLHHPLRVDRARLGLLDILSEGLAARRVRRPKPSRGSNRATLPDDDRATAAAQSWQTGRIWE